MNCGQCPSITRFTICNEAKLSEFPQVEQKSKVIMELIKLRFPEIANWERPQFYKGVSPYDAAPLELFIEQRKSWLSSIEAELLSHDKLSLMVVRHELEETGFYTDSNSDIYKLLYPKHEFSVIPWWSAGFSVLGSKADFEHWARISDLSFDEAVALSIGYDPVEILPSDRISKHLSKEVSQFYEKRADLISRELFRGTQWDAKSNKISAETLCRWAIENKLELPPDLIVAVNKIRKTNFKVPSSKKNADSSKGLQNRERASMLKMIIAMAVDGYGYKIDSERSSIPAEIADALDQMGISLDPDTIRKYLTEGRDMLPNGFKQE